MHLAKIKLAGFKTFVDPTTLPLEASLVGIVGPNGCGKSNIIDAVRWVMGESSPRHLRGEAMSDVIFNGSSARKPVGQASVELVFDNSDGRLGGAYGAFSEISVKRVVGRDGQSLYFLNGTRCRRRDITDVFLGTGLGPRSYAIIEQGMISRFIEARPEELRLFIEEAAGISRYKERRRETEMRLRHAQENLERVQDLRGEIEKHIHHLKRQAQAAKRYRRLEEEARLLRGQIWALRLKAWEEGRRALEGDIAAREREQEKARATLRALEGAMEKLRLEHHEAESLFQERQKAFYTLSTRIAKEEAQWTRLKERHAESRRTIEQLSRALAEGKVRLERERARLLRLEEDIRKAEEAQRRSEADIRAKERMLLEEEAAMKGWEEAWEALNAELSGPSQALQVERARLEGLERERKTLERRRHRLKEDLEERGEDPAPLIQALGQAQGKVDALSAALASLGEALREGRHRQREKAEELEGKKGALTALRARIASLQALQEDALGSLEEPPEAWRGRRRLAQHVEVEEGWERAVEMVLAPHLQALCLPELSRELLASGISAFLTEASHPSWREEKAGCLPLSTRVRAPWPLDALMAGVYGAEDEARALALLPHLASWESVVTPQGLWLGPNWMQGGSGEGPLVREQAIRRLSREADVLEGEVDALAEEMQEAQGRLEAMERERREKERALHQAQRDLSVLEAEHAALAVQRGERERRRARAQEEHEELEEQFGALLAEMEATGNRLQQAKEAVGRLEGRRSTLKAQKERRERSLSAARRAVREAQEAAHRLALEVQALHHRKASVEEECRRLERQAVAHRERMEAAEALLKEVGPQLASLEGQLSGHLKEKGALEREKNAAEAAFSALKSALEEREKERQALARRIEAQGKMLEQGHGELEGMRAREQAVKEEIEENGFNARELLESLPPEADEAMWKGRLEQVMAALQRLGAVNLAAVTELEQEMERKAHLDAQCADVEEALVTLQKAIQTIDRETRERFKATFDRLNQALKTLFPRLFGGGEASLALTGDALLDAGVVLMARPPGKRNTSLHLLSGGEKALAAVALVFALFSLNPAPFCLLDEVDAPLDDANVERFCKLVEEMSAHTQFIVVTHNKVTMEMVHQLVGVTMQEPGVSRPVAVDVEKALGMAV